MRGTLRIAACLALIGVIAAAGMTLMAKPDSGKFTKCPYPPCMAPCVLGAEPTVLCKAPGGGAFKTTFACCCCGGSENSYKLLN